MDSGGVPGRTSSLPEVSCKIRNNVGARTSTRKREDNLSRPRPMEFLLSASRNSYLRFRDSSLSLPISYSRDKSRSGIVTILPKVAYIWARLGPRTSERKKIARHFLSDISFYSVICNCHVARISAITLDENTLRKTNKQLVFRNTIK